MVDDDEIMRRLEAAGYGHRDRKRVAWRLLFRVMPWFPLSVPVELLGCACIAIGNFGDWLLEINWPWNVDNTIAQFDHERIRLIRRIREGRA